MSRPRVRLFQGDSAQLLRCFPENYFDSVVCDPPAGIEFMGKAWDKFSEVDPNESGPQTAAWHEGGRNPFARGATPRYQGKTKENLLPFQDFIAKVFSEVYRVLKPGGHALVWALPRTSHHTTMGLERAGFEVRDIITHLFGSGFPKSMNVSIEIDKRKGKKREVVGRSLIHSRGKNTAFPKRPGEQTASESGRVTAQNSPVLTAPASPEAAQWEGWGTALKPAAEFWVLARKPFATTVAANVLCHGTGALNIDGCRVVATAPEPNSNSHWTRNRGGQQGRVYGRMNETGPDFGRENPAQGRWPATVVLSHTERCVKVHKHVTEAKPKPRVAYSFGAEEEKPGYEVVEDKDMNIRPDAGYGDTGGASRYFMVCAPDCPIKMLDEQSGTLKSGGTPSKRLAPKFQNTYTPFEGSQHEIGIGSSLGGASRFFYCAKPSRRERDFGCEDLPAKSGGELTNRKEGSAGTKSPRAGAGRTSGGRNIHPTVKAVSLCSWLIRLITPPNGIVLDPFMGSGSIGIGAVVEGFRFVGIEQNPEYHQIAAARVFATVREVSRGKLPDFIKKPKK